ncbi:hypothetical protein Rsub_06653 [Raphidocelis subcapitata]|uniref:Fe/B12 periplasmic-binding domain-containing protein n=1 Tax=Raphidocelis subcapitata TaxID=307507 RepID=A0A2V0P6P0_9CHLO|nr:hypothetical protein Rsub_06653 [Raphidocelis subcapitata]|eukprot:GBF93520.1 hypothetical protein Rsub_06653 [Raphidocelis subcapitata]
MPPSDAPPAAAPAPAPAPAPPPARAPRVVSLLPSATEIVCAVGGAPLLAGRSHECDWPPAVRGLPILTAAKTKFENSQQMHDAVVETLSKEGDSGMGLYSVDAALMEALGPDVIVTQSLCEVCSVDMRLVERLCGRLQPRPRIISLNPFSIEDVLRDCVTVGAALGLEAEAEAAAAALSARVEAVRAFAAARPAPGLRRVGWMEWTEPIFCAGHWTPQLIAMAGGEHPLNPAAPDGGGAAPSRALTNEEFVASDPDWVIVCPCGFDLAETKRELARITGQPWWRGLRAVRAGRVALVDGNAMFNRPGPRLVEGLEFLAGLLQGRQDLIPEGFPWEWWRPEEAVAAGEEASGEAAAAARAAAAADGGGGAAPAATAAAAPAAGRGCA